MHADRFGSVAVAATVVIMFLVMGVVIPMFESVSASYQAAAVAAGVLGSMALYRGIASLLFAAFQKNLRFRKFVLGPEFLEGTWVGFFSHGDSCHFTVEFFNQESGGTKITGREIDSDGKTYASWNSDATSVSTEDRKLLYAYTCDLSGSAGKHQGIAVFSMVGSGKMSPPDVLDGYSCDLTDGKKNTNKEYKISDDCVDDHKALVQARLHQSLGGPLRDKALLQGTGTRVYFVENGKRRWIINQNVLSKMGLSLSNVIRVSDEILEAVPKGKDIR